MKAPSQHLQLDRICMQGQWSSKRTSQGTKVNGLKNLTLDKVKEHNIGLMVQCTKAGGRITKPTAKEDSSTLTEMSTKETGSTTSLMEMEPTLTPTVLCTTESGRRISSTERVMKHGLMVHLIGESTQEERRTAKESSPGLMEAHMMDTLSTTSSKDSVDTAGPTAESSKEAGPTTKWKVQALSTGLMVESTLENLSTTKSMAMETSHGLMARGMLEDGMLANSMELLLITHQMARANRESGLKEKD